MQLQPLSARYGLPFQPRLSAGVPLKTIHEAAAAGDDLAMEAFIAAGHQEDRESSMTPLHVACEHGHLACVKVTGRSPTMHTCPRA